MFKICAIFLTLLTFVSCIKSKRVSVDSSRLEVSDSDLSFNVEKLESEPGKTVAFKLVNGLRNEKLRFYLLNQGEDPILVQHLKVQQGEVPKEYVYFSSQEVSPKSEIEVTFEAPESEGTYAYVGVSAVPRETMVGHLIVQKKQEVNLEKEEL